MFLCRRCHDETKHLSFKSHGRCEGCGKVADCIDCHYPVCRPPRRAPVKKKPVSV